MAENKKSIIIYTDIIHTVRKMPIEKAGELFLTILSYANDENPVVSDMVVDLVFEPIKRQMKRDLKKYENKLKQWSEAGKASAKKRSTKVNDRSTDVKKRSTVSTVNVTVNDNVNVIIDYLNLKANTSFKNSTPKTISAITARLNEKFTVEDFKKVIDNRVSVWGKDEKMKEYLRPETLFSNKFEGYLNAYSSIVQDNKTKGPADYTKAETDKMLADQQALRGF